MATDLTFNVSARDSASKEFLEVAAAAEAVKKKLKDLDKTKAEPKVDVDTSAADKKIERFAASMRKKIDGAVKNLPAIEITADSSDADRDLAQVRKELLALRDKEIGVDIDAGAAEAKLRELRAKLTRLNADSVDLKVKADTLAAVKAIGGVKLDAFTIEVDTREAEQEVGAFARDLRKKLEAAAKALPELELDADASPAEKRIQSIRRELAELSTQRIGIDIDANDAEARMRLLQGELGELADASTNIQIRADATQAVTALGKVRDEVRALDREAGTFARNFDAKVSAAIKALPDLELDLDSTAAQREIVRIRGELTALSDKRIGVDIDAAHAQAELERLHAELDRLGTDSADVQVQTDVAAAMAALGIVSDEVDKLDGKKATVKVDVDKSLGDSLIHVTRLASALGSLALPAAALAAAPQIAAIGSAAVTASGALLLIPAAGGAAALGIGAVTLGLSNLGDALGDSPKKAAEAMAKLSDNGKELVTSLKGLSPAWTELRKAVQDAFLEDAGAQVKALGATYLPILKTALVGIAADFNEAGQQVAEFFKKASTVADVKSTFGELGTALGNVVKAAAPLARAFVDIAAAGAGVFEEITRGAGDAATKFADFISKARESGQLEEWMRGGVDALKELASIAGNVGSALMSVFSAAKASGADFLGTLDQLTQKMADFLKSGEGQSALVSLFQDIRAGVDAATPGLEALVKAVADVIQALGDAGVLEAAGRAFTAIAEQVAPMISSLGGLAPILAGILNTAAGLAPVLVPIAAALGAIKLASAGTDKLSAIGTSLGVIGREAKDADGKVNGLAGKLGGLKGAMVGIGPVGFLSAVFAVDAATNQGISDLLNHIAGLPDAAARAKAGIGPDFWSSLFQSPAASPNDRWDVRNIGKTMSDALADTKRQLSGFQLEPVTLDIKADSTAASIAARGLLDNINSSEAKVNINGNDVPAGFALRQVISEINAGKGEVIIDGKPMPAQDALQSVIDTINAGAGVVEINGEAKPAGEVLRDLLNRANAPGQATVPIGGDKAQYDETLRDGVGAALATNAMIPISGDPADFQGIVNNLISGVNAASGTIRVNGNTMPAGDALNSVLQAINSGQGTVTINGEEMNVTDALYRVTQQIDSTTGTVLINGNQVPASEALQQTVTSINAGQGTVRINGDDVPVGQVLTALGGKINAVSGTVSINGNPQPANTALATVISLINGGAGSVTINGVTMPAQAALSNILGQVNAGSGTITVNGQSAPAQTVLQSVIAAVNSGSGTITVNGQSVPADQALGALVSRINGSSGTVTANANTGAAASAINSLTTPRTVTIRAVVQADYANAALNRMAHGGAGGGLVGYAGGGVLPQRFARGGVIPGYGPGKDTVPAVLSRGEAVLVPELVRALGAANIIAANRAASGRKPTMWSASGRQNQVPSGGRADAVPERLAQLLGMGMAGGGMIRAEDGSMVPASFYSKISPQLRAKQDGRGIAAGEIAAGTWANLQTKGWATAGGRLYYPGTAPALSSGMTQVRAAVATARPTAPGAGLNLGPMLGVMRQQIGQLRALRGDVDQSAELRAIAGLLQQLNASFARTRNDPAATNNGARRRTDLGPFG